MTNPEQQSGSWLGTLDGVKVREPGPDAEGPVLELYGSDDMAAVEIETEDGLSGLNKASAEMKMAFDELGDSDE